MAAGSRRKRRKRAPALVLSSGVAFPLRQQVRVPMGPWTQDEARASAVLASAGFDIVRSSPSEGPADDSETSRVHVWVGERGLRRRGGTASIAVVPIITLFVAGSILGGFDAYVAGSLLVGMGWVLGAALVAGVFWLRYGRTYDSDVVMVTLSQVGPASDSGANAVSALVQAARIRSQVRSGVRIPTAVDAPIRLATEVGSLARALGRKVGPVGASGSPAEPAR